MSSGVRYQIFAADGIFLRKTLRLYLYSRMLGMKVDASDLEFDPERENARDRSATELGQQFS